MFGKSHQFLCKRLQDGGTRRRSENDAVSVYRSSKILSFRSAGLSRKDPLALGVGKDLSDWFVALPPADSSGLRPAGMKNGD
jgi:hypothetical protein